MLVHEINAIYYDVKKKKSIIYSESEIVSNEKPIVILETLCHRYGLSCLGSFTAIKECLNIHQKCPVLVHPLLQIYFFPTCSYKDDDCVWINSKQIKQIKSKDVYTEIVFNNGFTLLCKVGIRSIKKQCKRCELMEQHILKQYKIDQLSLKL